MTERLIKLTIHDVMPNRNNHIVVFFLSKVIQIDPSTEKQQQQHKHRQLVCPVEVYFMFILSDTSDLIKLFIQGCKYHGLIQNMFSLCYLLIHLFL